MKLFNKALCAVAVISAIFGTTTANASVIDTVERNPDAAVNSTTSVLFNHDFTDQGFIFGTTNYLSGTLRVRLTDMTSNENGTITFGTRLINFGNIQNNTFNDLTPAGTFVDFTLDAAALADLNADGMIAVAIRSTSNAFYFADSVLTLEAATPAAAVPEPMSIALLGVGMLGIGAMRRRSQK